MRGKAIRLQIRNVEPDFLRRSLKISREVTEDENHIAGDRNRVIYHKRPGESCLMDMKRERQRIVKLRRQGKNEEEEDLQKIMNLQKKCYGKERFKIERLGRCGN